MSETFSKIVSSNKTRLSRLAAIWLFLIALPPLVLLVAFDLILQESEGFLADKLKIRMMQDLSDFRGKLSFCSMIEHRMQNFAESEKSADSAEQLQLAIQTQTKMQVCAVFMINSDSRQLSYHLSKEVKPVLGMISKTMMRNFLLYLQHDNNSPRVDAATIARSRAYVQGLFATAGELSPKLGQALPALSGKPEFGRLIIWTMPVASDGNALIIFREADISPQQLAEFAADNSLFSDLKRSFAYSGEGRNTIYRYGQEMIKFETAADGGLILKGMASEEMLLRLATKGDYFPVHLDKLYEKLPILKISAPASSLQHPLRKILAQAQLTSLALILISSIFLLRIALFGYGRGLNIRNRLLLCVLGASILPFSTFMAGIFYHQHFADDFASAEISQYLYLQQEFVIKSINARVEIEERRLAELSETLGKLNHEEAIKYLSSWQKDSNSGLVLYSQDGHETTFTSKPGAKLNQTESDMKTIAFISLKEALAGANRGSQASTSTLGAVGLKIKGLSIILENVGRLYDAMSDNIVSIFSAFPVYAENQRFNAPKAYILAKYYTDDLIMDYLRQQPEALKTEEKGKYLVKSCFLPVMDSSKLPSEKDAICSRDFSMTALTPLIRKTMRTKSVSSWSNEKITALACYYSRLHCIIIHTAQLNTDGQHTYTQILLPGIAYFLLMVFTLVVFMAKMLIVPIELLKDAATMVADGNYQHRIEFASGDEFEPLANSFNLMTAGLRQRDQLANYVSQDVLEDVSSGVALVPGGEKVEASVVFCGLEGFKKFSQTADPEQIVSSLARLLEVAELSADKHGGVIDKLIEDTIMLVFRRRDQKNSHALSACQAALEICRALPDDSVPFRVVTGIASGTAVSGKIGSKTGKLDFTLIGNPVNLAARLKAQAHKAGNTGIIICPGTIRLLKGRARQRFIERTEIKGRSRTFPLYELIELR